LPTNTPTTSPTTYCYEPCPDNLMPVYDFIETIGGDMVAWVYAHYKAIDSKADQLWRPEQGSNKGQQPSGQTQWDPTDDDAITDKLDDDGGHDDKTRFSGTEGSAEGSTESGPASTSSSTPVAGADGLPPAQPDGTHPTSSEDINVSPLTGKPRDALRSLVGKQQASSAANKAAAASAAIDNTKEGAELKRLVEGFVAQAHLTHDATPTQLSELERKAAEKREASEIAAVQKLNGQGGQTMLKEEEEETAKKAEEATGGVPAGSAVLLAAAALALGVAFQNQKAWADLSSERFSRMEYSALM